MEYNLTPEISRLFRFWLQRGTAWGGLVFIGLSGLDYFIFPDHFRTFLLYRIAAAFYLLGISFLSGRTHRRVFHRLLAYLAVIGTAVTVELMILKTGGHTSPYYVGMILVGVCIVGFIEAEFFLHVTYALLIYLIYLLPIVLSEPLTDFRFFFTANFFIVGVLVSALVMRFFGWKRVIAEMSLRHELEEYHRQLESLVEERTLELSTAKKEWEETFDIINDAITVHDSDFNIIQANRAAQKILKVPFLDLYRQKCYGLFHGAGCPPVECPSCQVLKTGEPIIVETFEPHLQRHLEIKALPRSAPDGRPVGIIHIVRDITARKAAEDNQKELQTQLLQAQKMESIGALAGGVAHDFNNILTAILGYSELILLKLPEGHALRKEIGIIHEAGEKAASLTRQLLAFSRKQVLEMKVVSLNAVVDNLAKILRRLLREDMTLEVKTKSPLKNILADADQIGQVLMNLVVNARDALGPGGKIIVSTRDLDPVTDLHFIPAGGSPESYILLSISDNGAGMPPEIQERIFEPFFTTKGLGKGTGLGLATAYGIVRQHNGIIRVQSAPGKGSTFNVLLPITSETAVASKTFGPEKIPVGTETLLVADDDAAIRQVILATFQPLGYRVITAVSGEDALIQSQANQQAIDLLLTDVVMTGINGKELADRLCRQRPGLKVLFMSGYMDETVKEQGLSSAGGDFLQKPVSPHQLAMKVREILDRELPVPSVTRN
jgi:signal transduction histidine kinase/CheY-like chemotaxis protein